MKAIETELPTAVLIGRANVGKSTLFNRLTETKTALISGIPGTTRDRKTGNVLWRGQLFQLIDTGGLEFNEKEDFNAEISRQSQIAIDEADVVVLVVDAREGVLDQDKQIAEQLKDLKKPLIVVANKTENGQLGPELISQSWYALQLPEPLPVSAIKGTGLGDMLDQLFENFEKLGKKPIDYKEEITPRIVFIGEPNVGKSSIVNKILKEDRFITSPIAHTTREPSDTLVEFDKKEYIIVDTAGIRRKARIDGSLEKAGVRMSLDTIRDADVAVLVLDASKAIDQQEKRLAGRIQDAGIGCVIAVNKWDIAKDKSPTVTKEFENYVHGHLPFIAYAPILTISAKEGQRIHKLFPIFDTIMEERARWIDDNALDKFLKKTISRHKPSRGKGVAHPTIFRLKQTNINPPKFELIIKGRRTDVLHLSYLRFLENQLRKEFGFTGTPIIIHSRPSKKL